MITPAKFIKSIGNTQFKIGLSFKEMIVAAVAMSIMSMFGFSPLHCLLFFVGILALLALKNKKLDPSYIENTLNRKSHIELCRVKIND